MAHINDLPNEILEHIFDYLDFRSRCNLRLVCRRWDDVAFSESFSNRAVVLAVNRKMDLTILQHRTYSNVSIRLDGYSANEYRDHLHVLPSVVPSPNSLRLYVAQYRDLKHVQPFINFSTVETFYLSGNMNLMPDGAAIPLQLQMDRLCTLYLDVFGIENVRFSLPNLGHLNMVVHSEEDLFLLKEFINQLHSLTIWLRVPYNLINFEMSNLRHLSFNTTKEVLTNTEPSVVTQLLKHCLQLESLRLAAKSINRYLLESLAENLPWLVELTIQVSEGTIYVKTLAKLTRLERLRIVGCYVSLHQAHHPSLLSLELCAENVHRGIHVKASGSFKRFTRLQRLGLMNFNFGADLFWRMSLYAEQLHMLNSCIIQLPELRRLRLSRCWLEYPSEIDELKADHPGLAIEFY